MLNYAIEKEPDSYVLIFENKITQTRVRLTRAMARVVADELDGLLDNAETKARETQEE